MQVMTFEEINAVSGAAQIVNLTSTFRSACFTDAFDAYSSAAIAGMMATGSCALPAGDNFGTYNVGTKISAASSGSSLPTSFSFFSLGKMIRKA